MMNKVFEIIEAKKIFDLNYDKLKILIHPKSYVHAILKFKNGLTKLLIHDTNMTIPIFNSLYQNNEKKLKSKKLNFLIINKMNFEEINLERFPVVKILDKLPNKNSLYETVIVAANDNLVKMFLNNKIQFLDISKTLLKILKNREFSRFKKIMPKNVNQINELSNYVSLKINSMHI